jgi:predicted helicase
VPKNFELEEKYNQGISINTIFKEISIGIQTEKDDLVINTDKKYLENLIDDLKILSVEELLKKYNSTKQKIELSKKDILENEDKIIDILYRPFDIQKTIFTGQGNGLMGRPRTKITKHFLENNNLAINFTRQGKNIYPQVGISKLMSSRHSITSETQVAPLYLYQENLEGKLEKIPNLDREVLKKIESDLGLKFGGMEGENLRSKFSPEDLLDYIYAVLHSPKYREKFKEFLKVDFPKIPFKVSQDVF